MSLCMCTTPVSKPIYCLNTKCCTWFSKPNPMWVHRTVPFNLSCSLLNLQPILSCVPYILVYLCVTVALEEGLQLSNHWTAATRLTFPKLQWSILIHPKRGTERKVKERERERLHSEDRTCLYMLFVHTVRANEQKMRLWECVWGWILIKRVLVPLLLAVGSVQGLFASVINQIYRCF